MEDRFFSPPPPVRSSSSSEGGRERGPTGPTADRPFSFSVRPRSGVSSGPVLRSCRSDGKGCDHVRRAEEKEAGRREGEGGRLSHARTHTIMQSTTTTTRGEGGGGGVSHTDKERKEEGREGGGPLMRDLEEEEEESQCCTSLAVERKEKKGWDRRRSLTLFWGEGDRLRVAQQNTVQQPGKQSLNASFNDGFSNRLRI